MSSSRLLSICGTIQVFLVLASIFNSNAQSVAKSRAEISVQPEVVSTTQDKDASSQQSRLDSIASSASPTEHRTTRRGRMLNLDRLTGEVSEGNQDKASGSKRQSRILSEDINLNPKSATSTSARSKMAISGFIPIVSLESLKGSKHLATKGDDEATENEDQQESQQPVQHESMTGSGDQWQQHLSGMRNQMIANFGAQTSLGHASFAPAPSNPSFKSQVGSVQEARAQRKLLPSGLLGGLSLPKRLGSQFSASNGVFQPNHQNYNNYMHANPQHQQPLQSQLMTQQYQQHHGLQAATGQPEADSCVCVPFFQCKDGYLSESQLSRFQLPHQGQQTPRALSFSPKGSHQIQTEDIGHQAAMQQQQVASFAPQVPNARPNELTADEIYNQLKQNIESQQLEQQAMMQSLDSAALVDERSKAATPTGSGNTTDETQARGFLDFQAGKRSSGSRGCGIMRTCCRLPASLLAGRLTHSEMAAGRPLISRPPPQSMGLPMHHTHHQNHLPQPSFLGGQFQLAAESSQLPAANIPLGYQEAPMRGPTVGVANAASGLLMSGRCGLRQSLGISGRVANAAGEARGESLADFGEFPAHAALLRRNTGSSDSLFVCSATLISSQWLVTAAHCVRKLRPDELRVRLGEWDVSRDDELYPFVELGIRELVIHPDFRSDSLANDLAALRLETSLDWQQSPHVAPACLGAPATHEWAGLAGGAGQRCWIAGWGKDAFGAAGAYQTQLRRVELPLVGRQECEAALRSRTRLGPHFRLHPSAMCAGGESGKDACEGDGGAGLYCIEPTSGLSRVVGLVSWGVGCGQQGVPGIYTDLGHFGRWLEALVAASGEEGAFSPVGIVSERSAGASSNSTLTSDQLQQDTKKQGEEQKQQDSTNS